MSLSRYRSRSHPFVNPLCLNRDTYPCADGQLPTQLFFSPFPYYWPRCAYRQKNRPRNKDSFLATNIHVYTSSYLIKFNCNLSFIWIIVSSSRKVILLKKEKRLDERYIGRSNIDYSFPSFFFLSLSLSGQMRKNWRVTVVQTSVSSTETAITDMFLPPFRFIYTIATRQILVFRFVYRKLIFDLAFWK